MGRYKKGITLLTKCRDYKKGVKSKLNHNNHDTSYAIVICLTSSLIGQRH